MCTPLAMAADWLILSVSFCLRMRVHPWMFWACLIIWIVLHYWIALYIASTPPSTMSTSYCHSLHFPISLCCYCIIDLYWIVLLPCIVYLHIPPSLQWVPVSLFSSPTCLLVCLPFSCRTDDLYCVLLLVYWHWHLLFTICLLPQLLRAVAPALTLIHLF